MNYSVRADVDWKVKDHLESEQSVRNLQCGGDNAYNFHLVRCKRIWNDYSIYMAQSCLTFLAYDVSVVASAEIGLNLQSRIAIPQSSE